jgi:hypothetical protein
MAKLKVQSIKSPKGSGAAKGSKGLKAFSKAPKMRIKKGIA